MGSAADGGFRNILCAVDLGAGDLPVREAHRLAGEGGARLTFLHVVPDLFPGAPMSPEGAAQAAIQRERLGRTVGDELERRVSAATGRDAASAGFEVEGGAPAAVIVRRAQELGADLIVLGPHGEGGRGTEAVGRSLLGSTATTVLHEAPCSVFVARGRGTGAGDGGKVLAAVDLLDGTAQVVRLAAVQAARRGGGLVVLHSLDPVRPATLADPAVATPLLVPGEASDDLVRAAQDRMRELVARIELGAELLVAEESPIQAILRTAQALDVDLVVLGAGANTGLTRLVLGSVAGAVVTRSPCNVLVVRQPSPPHRTA